MQGNSVDEFAGVEGVKIIMTGATGLVGRAVAAALEPTARVPLRPLAELTEAPVLDDLRAKLLGQVALARRAARRLPAGGSITLTAGTFTKPIPGSALGALVNAGLEGFVRSAAAELPRGPRINVVGRLDQRNARSDGEDGDRGTPVAVVAVAAASSKVRRTAVPSYPGERDLLSRSAEVPRIC